MSESTLYYFYSVGCGWCKRTEPLIDELNETGNYDILKLDLSDANNQELNKQLKEKYNAKCGTPWLINAETGHQICGFREKDIVEKWAKGEEIPEPPKPKSPPPPPPQDYNDQDQVDTWKKSYEDWCKENSHLPNLPPVDQMLDRLKQQKQMMDQRQAQMAQQGQIPNAPTVQHQKNLNTEWYYTVEGNEKIEVHADVNFISSLKPQYYQREQDGKLSKVVDDMQFEARQKTRQIANQKQQQKGSPAPPASNKPPKKKKKKK